jgi:hypothetical protein
MLSPTQGTRRACPGSLGHLKPSGTAERFIEVARLWPIARALAPSDLTLEPRPLRSTIVTRFTASMGLSDFPPSPGSDPRGSPVTWALARARRWISRVDAWVLCAHAIATTPVLQSGAPIARFPLWLRSSLVCHQIDSHIAPLSRLTQRSLLVIACALTDPLKGTFSTRGFDPDRYRPEPLRLFPAGATVAGWDTFLPLDHAPFSRRTTKRGLRRLQLRRGVHAGIPARQRTAPSLIEHLGPDLQ